MKKIIPVGRLFFAMALIVYGLQQFVYANFRPVFVPAWQLKLPGLPVWAYLLGVWLIVAGLAIVSQKKAKAAALLTGTLLLALFCLVHIPFEIIADPYSKHLGSWTNALKELALAGGAFVVAGSFTAEQSPAQTSPSFITSLEKFIPFGKVFFSITMTCFGIAHLLYAKLVANLVPAWFPYPVFCTYFAGVALIGAGLAIILNIWRRQVATLLGAMILFWFIVLHVPRAIATPYAERGNELSSAFDALAFSGIAFIIASGVRYKKK